MAIEQGIVTKMGANGAATAWVQTVRSSSCESCSARHSCKPGEGGKTQEVEAINAAHARVGDLIQLSISTGSLLKATFLLYLFPIICMLIGGIIGHAIAPQLHVDTSVLSATLAIAGLAAALILVRKGGRRLAQKDAYRPQIIRILGQAPQPSAAPKQ